MPTLRPSLLVLLCVFIKLAFVIPQAHARPNPEEIVKMSAASLNVDGADYLAVTLRHLEGWHTYWKNPGDSGLPTRMKFSSNNEPLELSALEWPAPRRYIEEGDILVFGHSADKTLFFKLPVDRLEGKSLEIHGTWLMCADICIPGEATIQGRVENQQFQASSNLPFDIIQPVLERRLATLPQAVSLPNDLDLVLVRDPSRNEGLMLYANLPELPADQLIERMNLLTPFPTTPLDFRREELFKDSSNTLYMRMRIDWDGRYQNPPIPLPENDRFDPPLTLRFLYANPRTQTIEVISKSFSTISREAGERLANFHQMLTPILSEKNLESTLELDGDSTGAPAQMIRKGLGQNAESLWLLLLFAVIGGFLLNLMPCVLPVISLKLFSLIKHKEEAPKRILLHNLSYTLGVLVTFWILAFVVIAIKSAGEFVGWGFQLQSPSFVAIMAVIIFVLSLNMFGLFEFRTPGGSKLGGVQLKDGFTGDFFSGVLATILSTPCSAPFLGTALTFAFLSSSMTIFLILTFVGIGLALPFLITGLFPALISFLPRPGLWMEHFKKFLGLTLILTTFWLLDVYSALILGTEGILKLQTLMALIFFALLMAQKLKRSLPLLVPLWTLIVFLSVNIFLTVRPVIGSESNQSSSVMLEEKLSAGLPFEAWSEDMMATYRDQHALVFMDFTAKWCLTCKVNERLVINTQRFRQMVDKYEVKLLLADWTRRDDYIGDFLKAQGMVGVPAYFIQRPDGTLINLGETLTFSVLEREFSQAQSAQARP
jgi:thiol:disulfide interchange protein/DsbC/DsbD-like thiol-disulfide interchange protein